jgi:ElaB/YqjD/DUF883 family membrane-anchored ribosome-binding protein
MTKASTETFFADLKAMIESAEALLHATADSAGEHVASARERTQDKLRTAREHLGELEEDFVAAARAKAKAADSYIHENPWRSIGVVAGLAFALGVLMGRRR